MLPHLSPEQQRVIGVLADAFGASGEELYLVGGMVRDVLLESAIPSDLDLATSATPAIVKTIAERISHGGTYDMGERFGTIGIVFPTPDGEPLPVEITTYRSEVYEPGSRHPAVEFGTSITEDLARRDITVNAMAVDVQTGALVDPYFGEGDLHQGLLKAVGDADARLREDPLRLLRVARFVAQLGFSVDVDTLDAMTRQADAIESISVERIWAELTRLLTGPYADHGLEVLLQTGLFGRTMPELMALERMTEGYAGMHREKDLWEHIKQVVVQSPSRVSVRWAALLHDCAKPLTRSVDARGEVHFFGHERVGADIARALLTRLKADRATMLAVVRMVDMHSRPAAYDIATWSDSAVRRLALEADGVLNDLIDLAGADVTSSKAWKQRAAATRVQGLREHVARLEAEQALTELQSPLDGNALMQMFERPPGRWIAEVKDYLRELVIEGDLASDDVETAADLARSWLGNLDS